MLLPPVVKPIGQYTPEERAVIAGFLLRMRQGTLSALAAADRGVEITTEYGMINQRWYYQICEQYSRFLLYDAGYPTAKNRMYAQEEIVPGP
jgi:hypothetical protein